MPCLDLFYIVYFRTTKQCLYHWVTLSLATCQENCHLVLIKVPSKCSDTTHPAYWGQDLVADLALDPRESDVHVLHFPRPPHGKRDRQKMKSSLGKHPCIRPNTPVHTLFIHFLHSASQCRQFPTKPTPFTWNLSSCAPFRLHKPHSRTSAELTAGFAAAHCMWSFLMIQDT